ncbi:MAG: response regulator [Deltaproteobacteria bacterium]|nr:response regulator [Deltaproteobacteria bacterium]
MKLLDNLTLKARVGVALAVVVAMTLALGLFSLTQVDRLAAQTEGLYEHPLRVSNAALMVSLGVTRMNFLMEDLTSLGSNANLQEDLAELREQEKFVAEKLDLIRDKILGEAGRALEQETRTLFVNWKPIRDETLRLLAQGDRKAAAQVRETKGQPYAQRIEQKTQELYAYPLARAAEFMDEARRVDSQARTLTIAMMIGAGALSSVLLLFVLRSVLVSVGSLKRTMGEITASGELVDSDLTGRNEIAEMARHFNALLATLRNQLWLREGLNALGRETIGEAYEDLLRKSIGFVSRHVEACAGALYAYDPAKELCELRASYAFVEREYLSNAFRPGEGIVGQVAVERRPILLKNIRRSEAEARTGTVSEPPRSIYALPLVYEDALLGVLEVAFFGEVDATRTEFLDAAGTLIATSIYTAAQAKRIQDLLNETQVANEALREKTAELNAANEELTAANSELSAQSHELQSQAEELRAQAAELEAKQAQVQEADRLKSEFLSNMSHELRTPLNSVLALSQLMIARGVGKNPDQEKEYLRVIERNGRQLLSLINDILDLSKIESGRMEVYSAELDPFAIAEAVIETVSPLAREKGLALKLVPSSSKVRSLESDEEKVRQILLNLVSNAVKFTSEGSVEVALSQADGWVSISVRDTGIGMIPEDLDVIFDEFRQVDGSTSRRHEGTGLGLAISQKLAKLLGGWIAVESAPGVGSTFALKLPSRLGAATAGVITAPPALSAGLRSPPAELTGTGQTVLVIDDEERTRRALADYLVAAGYRPILARSGPEGLELARRHKPFAITLDLIMPEMDGWEVISRLKRSPETAEIPVVFVSVSDERATGRALGGAGFLVKPVDPRALEAELGRIARAREIRRVLVVDDDPVVREELSSFLGERGYRVEAVSNGADALSLAAVDPPDAVILDLMMPELDGFTVLDRLRSSRATAEIPVIILTAKDLTAEELRRLAAAAHRVVAKGHAGSVWEELDRVLRALSRAGQASLEVPGAVRLLVVEDNPTAALQIRTALEENGYSVDVAPGGREAVERLRAAPPSGMILDLMMPDVDGFQVLEELRADPVTAALPVLVLTAKELTAADRARLARNRAQELVQKGSLDREQLVRLVGRMLAGTAPAPSPAPGPETAGAGNRGLVLIVEDNADNRFTIGALLEELGLPYRTAEDGEQALRAVRELRPALVLMDVQLPGMTGLEATRRLKDDPEFRDIPIVALTAKAMKGDREAILAAGCDDYLAKPLENAALEAAVRKWVR